MNLFLIGYRGSGKSTVARALALRRGCDWVDADVEVELRAGKSIAEIFADEGEAAFRDLESRVLEELSRRGATIVACGGGAVLRPENRRLLRSAGKVAWLKASPETIIARLAADPATAQRRPALTSAGGLAEVVELLKRREPLYRECADLQVDTEGKSPAQIADEILHGLGLPADG